MTLNCRLVQSERRGILKRKLIFVGVTGLILLPLVAYAGVSKETVTRTPTPVALITGITDNLNVSKKTPSAKGPQSAKVQVASFEQALQHYYLENNAAYPASLDALVPDYIEDIPLDPWGKPYVYHFPGSHNKDFDIESGGPDGAIGGEDDITNYTK